MCRATEPSCVRESGSARMSRPTQRPQRARLARQRVRLRGVEQPRVHARWCRRRGVRPQVRLVLRAQRRGAPPRAPPATSRRHRGRPAPAARRRGRRSRCARRTARRWPARRARPRRPAAPARRSARPAARTAAGSRSAASASARPAELLVGQRAGRGQRVHPGKRLERRAATAPAPGRAARSRPGPRPRPISSPAPSRTSSSVDAEPSSTALAWAPRSSDSAGHGRARSGAARGRAASRRCRPARRRTPRARPRGRPGQPRGSGSRRQTVLMARSRMAAGRMADG